MEETKDLNRIKVMLVEKNEPANGWQSSWGKTLPQLASGVPMPRSRHSIFCWPSPIYWKLTIQSW